MSQLGAYLAQQPPFDLPFTQTTAQSWWQRVGGHQIGVATAELVSLAVFVCDLAPHAASVERVSSLMGWYHTPVRSSLSTETLAMMVALKAHLQLHVPRWAAILPSLCSASVQLSTDPMQAEVWCLASVTSTVLPSSMSSFGAC